MEWFFGSSTFGYQQTVALTRKEKVYINLSSSFWSFNPGSEWHGIGPQILQLLYPPLLSTNLLGDNLKVFLTIVGRSLVQ